MRASRASEENLCISQFQTCYKLLSISAPLGANILQVLDEIIKFWQRKWPVLRIFHMQLTCTYIVNILGGGLEQVFWGLEPPKPPPPPRTAPGAGQWGAIIHII